MLRDPQQRFDILELGPPPASDDPARGEFLALYDRGEASAIACSDVRLASWLACSMYSVREVVSAANACLREAIADFAEEALDSQDFELLDVIDAWCSGEPAYDGEITTIDRSEIEDYIAELGDEAIVPSDDPELDGTEDQRILLVHEAICDLLAMLDGSTIFAPWIPLGHCARAVPATRLRL